MTRLATIFDRLAALIVGVALIAFGVTLAVWNTQWGSVIPNTIAVPALHQASAAGWWPFALAGVGIVLAVVALRWLSIHTPAAKVKDLPLRDSDSGSITIDLGEVATAAARALQQSLDVESASAKAIIDRGTRTVDVTVTTVASARPDRLIPAIDAACVHLSAMLADPSVATRTTIRTGKRERRRAR